MIHSERLYNNERTIKMTNLVHVQRAEGLFKVLKYYASVVRTQCALRDREHGSIFTTSWGILCRMLTHRDAHRRTCTTRRAPRDVHGSVPTLKGYTSISCWSPAEAVQVGHLQECMVTDLQ